MILFNMLEHEKYTQVDSAWGNLSRLGFGNGKVLYDGR